MSSLGEQPKKGLVSAYFRGYMYDGPLKELGIETRHISKVDTNARFADVNGNTVDVAAWSQERLANEIRNGDIHPEVIVDASQFEWADIVVFRRYYNTSWKCARTAVDFGSEVVGCGFVTRDEEEARKHPHGIKAQDSITRTMWPNFRDHWTGGIIYETDDNHWEIKPWNGYYGDVVQERDLIADMTRRADLVTVSTPNLMRTYGRYNSRIRVIRNALDPDLYVKDTPRPAGDKPRLVYYGSTARLRDYAATVALDGRKDGSGYARLAVDSNKHLLHRVFIGTNPGTEDIIDSLFDEQQEYISSISGFAKALANSHGDIGIAPLGGDDFDQAKSELHWLEYAMTDMASVCQKMGKDGPYSVVRDGVDGLLARSAREWHDAVKRLATSQTLREEIAGRAKERVLAEYDYRQRAQEWADAYRWVAEHPGIGQRKELVAA